MNVQFGTGFTITPSNNSAQGSDARVGVAVPVESENQSTTSFTAVPEAKESPKSRQEGSEQGQQERLAVEARRARQQQDNQQEQRLLDRRADDARQQDRKEEAQQRTEEQQQSQSSREQAQARRQQDEQEQRQLEVEQRQVQQLAERDREVKAHEQAHQAVGGQYAGAMSLTYERGPDGKNYAIGGEVPIDTGKIANDPQATLDKAETIRRAALAPAEPSSQDRRVASQAIQIGLEARAEIQQQQLQQQQEALTSEDVNEEQTETDDLRDEERLEAEQKAQQEQQAQESTNSVIADLQDLNEQMARIQAQLVEASQIDDKINSKVNLLDVTT